jgi:hypothetical protein
MKEEKKLPGLPPPIKQSLNSNVGLPSTLKDIRVGDNASFYIKPTPLAQVPDRCANFHIDTTLPNIDLIKKRGRNPGKASLYSADQVINYQSESTRYDKALNIGLHPDHITTQGNSTIYYFCSSDSPTGYWEVTVAPSGTATYINFAKNPLTIICPAPFKLSALAALSTDSSTIQWTQIDGNRTVLIESDTDFDPTIDIQLTCYTGECSSASLSPLILRAQTDNDLLFADLYIFNRLVDEYYGLGYSYYQDDVQCRKVNSVHIVPKYTQKAYTWTGDPLLVTWDNPACDVQFLTGFQWQSLTPPYANYLHFGLSDVREIYLTGNTRYRIVTEFNVHGKLVSTPGDPIFFTYDPTAGKVIFADDAAMAYLGYAIGSSSYSKIMYGVKVSQPLDTANTGLGYAISASGYSKVAYGVKVITLTDAANTGLGYSVGLQSYAKINLGGIIIG